MSKFPEDIVYSDDVGDFTETIEFVVLSCGNIHGNNNKFYCLEIQKNKNGRYRLFCHRGRVGTSNVYTTRENLNGKPITSESEIKKEFDAIVKKKLKGKSKTTEKGDDYTEKYELVKVTSPSVGSKNIRNASSVKVKKDLKIKDKIVEKTNFHPSVKSLIIQFYDENIHNIQHTTTIQVNASGGLETALGPLTQDYIKEARVILQEIQKLKGTKKSLSIEFKNTAELNNRYLSMVPRDVGRKITEKHMILTDERLIEEFELLDQLDAAVQMNTVSVSSTDDMFDFGFEMMPSDKDITKQISKWFEDSRANNHGNLRNWKVVNCFDILVKSDRTRFETCTLKDDPITLWHGSKNCNILSILMNGLIIPKANAPHVTGRMFGDGVYAASNSTKALNYSVGYWSGTRNKNDNAFLFNVQFKMGNIYYPKRSMGTGTPPDGYHSTHATVKNTGLYNDEYIVYSLEQQTLTRLIELKEK